MLINTDPTWDHPEITIERSFIICAAPRTGSNLLAFTLAEQGLGVPLEYLNIHSNPSMQQFMLRMLSLNPNSIIEIKTLPQLKLLRSRYISQVLKHRTTPNGYFGIKVFPAHLLRLFPEDNSVASLCAMLARPQHFIHIQRQALCEMAVSYHFAQTKQEWHTFRETDSNNLQVRYDYTILFKHLQTLHANQIEWVNYLKDIPQENILSFKYESIANNFVETIKAVNNFLEVDECELPEAPIPKQSSPEKTAMVERFKEECRIKEPWVFDVDYSVNAGTVL